MGFMPQHPGLEIDTQGEIMLHQLQDGKPVDEVMDRAISEVGFEAATMLFGALERAVTRNFGEAGRIKADFEEYRARTT